MCWFGSFSLGCKSMWKDYSLDFGFSNSCFACNDADFWRISFAVRESGVSEYADDYHCLHIARLLSFHQRTSPQSFESYNYICGNINKNPRIICLVSYSLLAVVKSSLIPDFEGNWMVWKFQNWPRESSCGSCCVSTFLDGLEKLQTCGLSEEWIPVHVD